MNLVKASGTIGNYIFRSTLPSGTSKIEFTLIVESNTMKDSKTNKKQVSYVNCQAFGKTAVGLSKVVANGRQLNITKGELKTTFKQTDDKADYRTSIIVQEFLFKATS